MFGRVVSNEAKSQKLDIFGIFEVMRWWYAIIQMLIYWPFLIVNVHKRVIDTCSTYTGPTLLLTHNQLLAEILPQPVDEGIFLEQERGDMHLLHPHKS